MWVGWIDAKLVESPSKQAANRVTRRRFAEQWSAPLRADGTVYSDAWETLGAERDYRQPRVAVHVGGKLVRWAMFDFGQGTPPVLVVLQPTARKQSLRAVDTWATSTARSSSRSSTASAGSRTVRLSPRPVPKTRRRSRLDPDWWTFPAAFGTSGDGQRSGPSASRRCSDMLGNRPILQALCGRRAISEDCLSSRGRCPVVLAPTTELAAFATGCHWLRPLGSINAPSPSPESRMRRRIRGPRSHRPEG
jgi:hypothetical protein